MNSNMSLPGLEEFIIRESFECDGQYLGLENYLIYFLL
ncbi:hypothetical protein J2Z82_003381 [Virgibacillus litoralis]|uniref:Sporulation histidine kinase inhibitor Sda n=1 Tax=Virgibacillus litoralis TaxID=578221 RepID=A0ABS4HHL9_9BACI|nr:hypothetical protein [Virgibacillus litoralis]